MPMPRLIGLVLVILGVVALSTGGFSYKKTETIAQIGDLKMRAEEKKQMAVPPFVSWIAIAGGAALVLAGGKRQA